MYIKFRRRVGYRARRDPSLTIIRNLLVSDIHALLRSGALLRSSGDVIRFLLLASRVILIPRLYNCSVVTASKAPFSIHRTTRPMLTQRRRIFKVELYFTELPRKAGGGVNSEFRFRICGTRPFWFRKRGPVFLHGRNDIRRR